MENQKVLHVLDNVSIVVGPCSVAQSDGSKPKSYKVLNNEHDVVEFEDTNYAMVVQGAKHIDKAIDDANDSLDGKPVVKFVKPGGNIPPMGGGTPVH